MLKTKLIKRNGYCFQVPDSPFCRFRFSVHPDGSGTGWTNVEAVDVDQPHGKDYLYSQHIAIGVRKRNNQEHSDYADATVGGIHTPGGCAILGMEISDDGGDITTPVVGDGTYRGHGLVWSWDGSQNARLWCATKAAGSSTTGDWTVLIMHPDKQWGGRDVTWTGAHEFDASVDISGNVAMDGDLTVDGVLKVDSSCEISDVFINGDISMTGSIKVATDVSITGDMAIDGTSNFYDEADFSSINASGLVGFFSVYTDEDSNTDAMLKSHVYLAATDGFVSAFVSLTTAAHAIVGYVGDTTDPQGAGAKIQQQTMESNVDSIMSIYLAVGKSEYFIVTSTSGIPTILWKSMGILSKPVDQD